MAAPLPRGAVRFPSLQRNSIESILLQDYLRAVKMPESMQRVAAAGVQARREVASGRGKDGEFRPWVFSPDELELALL